MMAHVFNASNGWALLAGGTAVGCEYLYRTLPGPWLSYLWAWVPLQVFVGYCVYRLVTIPGTSLIDAFIVWTFVTIGLRVTISSFLLGDQISNGTWFALALMLLARVAQVGWGK